MVLDFIRSCPNRLSNAVLQGLAIDDLQAADLLTLSADLWSSLETIMTDSLLARREALAGGEEANGFELWRILYWDHEGEAQQCQIAGVRSFLTFGQCKDIKVLNAHIGEWFRARNRYGGGVPPAHLREMFINAQPTKFKRR